LSSTGYATYHLKVTGLPQGRLLGLKITCPLSAARVYVDGDEVLAMGKPGRSESSEMPRWDSAVVAISSRTGTSDIVIHVSNYVDYSGGLTTPILLGDYKAVWAVRTSLVTLEMFELGALAIIGFYLILLFAFRPTEKYALFFGLLSLVLAFRTLCYDEFVLLTLFPQLPFPVLFRVGYLTFSLPFALLSAFFRYLFPRYMPQWLFAAVVAFSAAFSCFIVFAPLHLVTYAIFPAELVALAYMAYFLFTLTRALIDRLPGSGLILLGLTLFAVPMIHDILVINGQLKGEYIAPFGTILFFRTLAVMISRNSALALKSREVIFVKTARERISLSEKGITSAGVAYAMALLAGKSVKEIAFEHDVTESTVRNSLARVYVKLGVSSMPTFMSLASRYDISP
jgi:DNA-binding CsgD family transcriptional regulator